MTADERHALARLKIDRASKHIVELEAAVRIFLESNPYKIATRRNPQTRQLIYYVDSVAATPDCIAIITGDAINNLRSALDHLATQLYLVGTNGTSEFRVQTNFPIMKGPKEFKTNLPGKVEGMRGDAIDAISALQPYKGGNGHDLWTLHCINNIDKHRLLVGVGSAFHSMNIGAHVSATFENAFGGGFPIMDAFFAPADSMCPLKAGDELFIDAPDAELNQTLDFRFSVALHEPEIIESKPLMPTLVEFRDRVSSIVESFKPCLA
jgi:hypothetical protein